MLISIIMPIYNAENYLEAAIQSVLDQSYLNFELILIDDCSNDRSACISKAFADKDSRIKFFKNEFNMGICATRNKGIACSKGEYVTFLDNDDELDKDFLLENSELLNREEADVVRFGRTLIDINKSGDILRTSQSVFFNESVKLFTTEDKYNQYHFFKKNNLLLNVWNGLYKKSVIDEHNLLFDETMKFGSEDAKFSYQFFSVCQNLIINPKSYYIHYRRDSFSTSRKYSVNKIESIVKTAQIESEIWQRINDEQERKYINDYKLQYIKIIISSQLLHEDCNLTLRQKKIMLKQITDEAVLKLDGKFIKNIFSLDGILEFLIRKRRITLLFFMYSGYKKIRGEKWN
jgi:glycosyltransferase involved in cell wall biosynthesis